MAEQRSPTIHALAGARAIPPLILVLFHFCETSGYFGVCALDAPIGKGYLWVEFFFALSGFVLIYVYGEQWAALWRPRFYLRFQVLRLARLYPLHLFTLLLMVAVVVCARALAAALGFVSVFDLPYPPVLGWPGFAANLFLVQAWNIMPVLTWNAPAWFVSVEFLLCLLFPLYALAAQKGMWRGIALIALGWAGLAVLAATSGRGLDLTFHNGIYRGMAAFAAGAGSAALTRAWAARAQPGTAFLSGAQIVLMALLLCAIYFGGKARTAGDILVVLPMTALIPLLAFDRGVIAAILQTRVLKKLGEWSYAIYLLQFPLIQILRTIRQTYPSPHAIVFGRPWQDWTMPRHWLEAAVLLAVVIVCGWLLTRWIEKPANRYLRRLAPGAPRA